MNEDYLIDIENARFFLKSIEDRNNTMIEIMHHYTNYVIALLLGIWTIVSAIYSQNTHSFQYNLLIIASIFSTILLICWRYYIHYLDNDIADNYKRLVFFEQILFGRGSIPRDQSTFYYLTNKLDCWRKLIQNSLVDWNDQYSLFCILVNNRRIGSRGQDQFDKISVSAIGCFLFIEIMVWVVKYNRDLSVIIVLAVLNISLFLLLCGHLLNKYAQLDPTKEDIERAISEMNLIKNK
jgi:hypothetical protein